MNRTAVTTLGLLGAAALLLAGPSALAQNGNGNGSDQGGGPPETRIHSMHTGDAPTAGGTGALSPITYHNGPVGVENVYLIWYGNWNQTNGTDTPAGQQLVRTFLGALGGSPYYRINETYSTVTSNVNLLKEYVDTGSQGTRLSDNKVKAIVSNAISGGHLPSDTNALYFVLTSSNVSESSGFCSRYCGWHTHGTLGGSDIKYSFVGNAARCLSGCAAQTISPNGNAGVDGMISVIAHELEEANTDPDLNAWYDSSGAENADKCAWTFGSGQILLPSGAYYNMTLGGLNFLVQRNLSAADNKCYVALNGQQ
jgi:hypothetical protein